MLTAPTLDPLAALAFAAAHNPRLKLGTTMLLPGRNVVRLAKQLATLDRLSAGRLLVTFVPGLAQPPESAAVGRRRPRRRAPWMDEAFPVLRRLWAGETVDHHGAGGGVRRRHAGAPARPGPARVLDWVGCCPPPSSGADASPTAGCRRRAPRPRWRPGEIVIDEAAAEAGRAISPEHFGVSLAYAPGPLDPSLLAALGAGPQGGRPGHGGAGRARRAAAIPRGVPRGRVLQVRGAPAGPPGLVAAELEALATAVGDLQT